MQKQSPTEIYGVVQQKPTYHIRQYSTQLSQEEQVAPAGYVIEYIHKQADKQQAPVKLEHMPQQRAPVSHSTPVQEHKPEYFKSYDRVYGQKDSDGDFQSHDPIFQKAVIKQSSSNGGSYRVDTHNIQSDRPSGNLSTMEQESYDVTDTTYSTAPQYDTTYSTAPQYDITYSKAPQYESLRAPADTMVLKETLAAEILPAQNDRPSKSAPSSPDRYGMK